MIRAKLGRRGETLPSTMPADNSQQKFVADMAGAEPELLVKSVGRAMLFVLGELHEFTPPSFALGSSLPCVQPMNPRLDVAKRPMFGSTVDRSELLTPNQVARVAAYSSTLVVGIQRPSPVSSGPLTVNVGNVP